MIKLFATGSCKLVSAINNGRDKVIPIHSNTYRCEGINYLGMFHDIEEPTYSIYKIYTPLNI